MGRTAPSIELLEQVQRLQGTPAAEAARLAQERIRGCVEFEARCLEDEDCGPLQLAERLTCRETTGGGEPGEDGPDWWFSRATKTGPGFELRGRVLDDGTVRIGGWIAAAEESQPLSLLLPSAKPPGAPQLSQDEALVHVHLRPEGGLDLGSLVSAEGWGARLFQLQSDLFLATTLEGTWEFSAYLPTEGQLIPPLALALAFTHRERAVAAMESFIDQVQDNWSVRRSPLRLGGWEGTCLGNLNLLPDLSPCYVATDEALVVGWNPLSLKRALAAAPALGHGTRPVEPDQGSETAPIGQSHLVLYLEHFPEADRRLARASGGDPASVPVYPWRGLRMVGTRGATGHDFEVEIQPWKAP